ncbi:hypothetical protein B0H21DRAFT_851361 [Amylocystis lapponica]|nr:hypothetical protein B0H21DRAFT_851361 [Amylocystis lapponica]
MGKREKVPTALHSELSEYAALLRALRTSNTLDLATQLTRSQPASERDSVDVEDNLSADEGESEGPLSPIVEGILEGGGPPLMRKRKRRASTPVPSKKVRDIWTRWPLLEGDVHVPEWGLEDEVHHIAVQFLVLRVLWTLHCVADDVDEDDRLSPSSLRNLVAASATHTSQILALLAAHVPYAENSMQNRVRPINWETVLDVVGANGIVQANVLDNVCHRMEAIYGPSSSHVVDRTRTTSAIENKLDEVCAPHEFSFLSVSGYDATTFLPKRKRGSYRKRKKAAQSTSRGT